MFHKSSRRFFTINRRNFFLEPNRSCFDCLISLSSCVCYLRNHRTRIFLRHGSERLKPYTTKGVKLYSTLVPQKGVASTEHYFSQPISRRSKAFINSSNVTFEQKGFYLNLGFEIKLNAFFIRAFSKNPESHN